MFLKWWAQVSFWGSWGGIRREWFGWALTLWGLGTRLGDAWPYLVAWSNWNIGQQSLQSWAGHRHRKQFTWVLKSDHMDCISLFQVDKMNVGHSQNSRTSKRLIRKLLCLQVRLMTICSSFFLDRYSVLCYLDKAIERAFVTYGLLGSGTSYFPMGI